MKGLAWHDGQVRRLKIIPGREYRFTPQRRQRINRAIAEVELRSVPLALSKARKRRYSCFRLRRIKWNNFAAQFFNQVVQRLHRLCAYACA